MKAKEISTGFVWNYEYRVGWADVDTFECVLLTVGMERKCVSQKYFEKHFEVLE